MMGGMVFRLLKKSTRSVAALLVAVILVSTCANGFIWNFDIPIAEAAPVTIDADASTTGTSHLKSGSQTVFIDDQTGYKFFRDAGNYCVYRKTTDGGATWSSTTTVDAQTDCIMVTVWYDQWTPGDMGTYIHIATLDTTADDIFYNRLDTNGDTLLLGSAPVSMVSNTAQGGIIVQGENTISITKGTDGTIYAVSSDVTDSYIVECSTNCHLAANWTETGTRPHDLANDYNILLPLASGNIMLINRDVSLEDMRSKIWNNTTWSASWTIFDPSATDNTTYDVGMAAVVSSSSPGTVYLAYAASNTTTGTDDEVRTAKYNGSTWSITGDVITASTTLGITNVAIGLDASNDDVYVAYTGRTTAASSTLGNVYWKNATSSMMNWSAATGPINVAPNDWYGIDMNLTSNERLYASWFGVTGADIFGETIIDLSPGLHASGTGSQATSTFASTTSKYMGGSFLFYETFTPQDVTGITITESGTIDASTDLTNIKLYYELDTSAPYNCLSESYAGSESQFGSTDTDGFSGADGTVSFTGTSVTVSTTSSMCAYVVMDILDSTLSSSTINLKIANPSSDVTVDAGLVGPDTSVEMSGSTLVYNDGATITHFHWRNDNGTEITASSSTSGTEDTAISAMRQGSTTRLRVEVSNEGSSSTPAMQYRLEYGTSTGACSAVSTWTDVGAAGGHFDMFNSTNLTNGNNTTNIAINSATSTGGVTDSNPAFLTSNAGIRDTTSQTGSLTLTPVQFVELEYSILASTTAEQGSTYCFRVTDQGTPLYSYLVYPSLTINADVTVSIATSSQITSTTVGSTSVYVGSTFTIRENSSSRNVTNITLTETGTVDAQTGLDNIKLFYDLDTSSPYNCAGESYGGSELQYGATNTVGFSSDNGTSTYTGSVAISLTSTMCVYTVLDITSTAKNGETINLIINNASDDVLVSGGGSVSPTFVNDLNGSTTINGPQLTQSHYHWRSDNGSEITASSSSSGSEDTPVSNIAQSLPLRLRVQVSNEGLVTSASRPYRIEYGAKISTCSAVSAWTDVGEVGGAWDMYNSTNITDGSNTTNIAINSATSTGGVTDSNPLFLTSNSAVKDTSSSVASSTLTSTQFIEAEYSMKQTTDAGYDTTYCFRITMGGTELDVYSVYPELTSAPKRDFEIQRNFVTITGTSTTIVAGTHYTAPSASTSAFIRITNVGMTGAGHDTGAVGAQNAADVTAYIVNPSNIMNSITFARTGTTNNTRVYWEIIEFIGAPGSDNEMIVRSQTTVTYGATATTATGTAATSVTDDADVVVFITGQMNPLANTTAYNTGISTSEWSNGTDVPVFRRGSASSNAVIVSYAVVEFKGLNWIVQRNQHTYTSAGITETESITAVNSLARTFVHAQKRNNSGLNGTDEFGHEVWISSVGAVSYFLESGATTPSGQTSVAWIIENIQITTGAMDIQRKNPSTNTGTAPFTLSVSLDNTLTDLTNTTMFATARVAGTGTTYPRAQAGIFLASTTAFEIWRSNTGANLTVRAEIVEWPTAGLAIKQNFYRFYIDNNTLTPTDAWPEGAPIRLGENTVLTAGDQPLGGGDRIRIRMSLHVTNATFPESTKAFRLQYAQMLTTCSGIDESSWRTVGDSASSTIWRGYNATGTTDGTELPGVLLSVSSVVGTFEEENDTIANPSSVPDGDDIEYDWLVEQNGAAAETDYCFRMIESNGSLLDGYTRHPQLRTASFTPRTQDWRWYDDEQNTPPTVQLGGINVTPINIANTQALTLRVTVKETESISRNDVRFKLQYSENANFDVAYDVAATSTCVATSTWCYANGGGTDNAKVSSTTLTDISACTAGVGNGCGTYNESPSILTGMRHEASAAAEYSFTIQSAAPRVNRVYYFRLYDLIQDIPVIANTNESYPSLLTEGASLTYSMSGVATSTAIAGITTDIGTQAASISFGVLPLGTTTSTEAAQRFTVTTNATEGYQLFMVTDGFLMSSNGSTIAPITSTNDTPVGWLTGCSDAATGCVGYHTSDATLANGSPRFSATDSYARLSTTTLDEIAYNSSPVTAEVTDVVFRVRVLALQPAGQYMLRVRYVAVPVF